MTQLDAPPATGSVRFRPPNSTALRALAIWPRLDRRALARCNDDPVRIARLVARRTSLGVDVIVRMLSVTDVDRERWFG